MSLKMEDTVKNRTCPKRPFAWYVEKPSAKDYLLTVFIFAVCTLIGLLFQKLDFTDTNIVTIYILGVLITSIVTDGYLCSVAGSFLSVFLFCFFLTEPRMSFETYAVGYPVTFFIMLISSVLTGTLAAKLKNNRRPDGLMKTDSVPAHPHSISHRQNAYIWQFEAGIMFMA